MKANELRSGSVISINGENVIVDHIKCHEDSVTIKNGFAIVFNDGDLETDGNDNIKPIVLTPEILEKCGFDYDASYEVPKVQKGNFILWDGFDGSFGANFGGLTRLDVSVQYLHQLQNLYFALTGEELEVKL